MTYNVEHSKLFKTLIEGKGSDNEYKLYIEVIANNHTTQYSAVQCSAVQCSAVQCSAVQCRAVQCSAVQCSAVQCSAVQCIAVQHTTVEYNKTFVSCEGYVCTVFNKKVIT